MRWVLWERDSIISSVNVSGDPPGAQLLLEAAARIADQRLADVIG